MPRLILTLCLLGSIAAADGCSRLFAEGLGTVRGAKGIAVVIDPVSPYRKDNVLGAYTRFELGTFTDGFGRTPREFFARLPQDLGNALAENRIPNLPGGKALVVRGRVLHYEDVGHVSSELFGPFEEVIARVELVDKATGRVLGAANCIGRSTETVNEGVDKKSAGMAKAIAEWIAQHRQATRG